MAEMYPTAAYYLYIYRVKLQASLLLCDAIS